MYKIHIEILVQQTLSNKKKRDLFFILSESVQKMIDMHESSMDEIVDMLPPSGEGMLCKSAVLMRACCV